MAHLLITVTLLILESVAAASSSSMAAFHGGYCSTYSVRRKVGLSPFSLTKTTPVSRVSQRSEITTMYKSKADKDDDASNRSKSGSLFKPWRWFARKERRKRQPKLSPTIESLLYAFKEAKDLGIIQVNANGDDNSNTAEVNNSTFQTQIAPETIQQIIAALPSDRPLIIENTFVGNTYSNTNQNGFEILPKVKFRNDMAGSFHNNNNAAAKYGNVTRQNGVADFTNSLQNNNNAVSETGDVSRKNGVFGPSLGDDYYYQEDLEEDDNDIDTKSNVDMPSRSSQGERKIKNQIQGSKPATASSTNSRSKDDGDDFFPLFGKQSNSNSKMKDMSSTVDDHAVSDVVAAYMTGSLNNATSSWYEAFNYNSNSTKPPVVVRNTYIGNKYETTTHTGLSLGVDVDFKNDMKEAFFENNNAVAYEGNVRRQNGVADFTNSLRKNNNAVSGSGDVERENGADVAALPLLVPLLDFNITLPSGSNATLFDAAFGGIFRLYKRKIKKKMEQKEKLKGAVVDYYKPKVEEKSKWTRLSKASKVL